MFRKVIMLKKEELINRIVEAEWKMFQDVPNIGGKASCQEDYRTFKINRYGQDSTWSEDVLESYLDDLNEAEKKKRNLLTEKYARMMKSTSPEEYAKIADLLPALSRETLSLVEEIIKIILDWEEEIKAKYPDIAKRGRPTYSSSDGLRVTSIETYLRGELPTYSFKTLKLYFENLKKQRSEKINASEIALEYMMRQYGFSSLKEANEKLKNMI
jgi:hypothetical protein